MTIPIGTSIGPYEIVGWLGAGGMGEVYRARDGRLARDVAIKLIPEPLVAADATRLRRFEQEARAAGQLNHPNILAVHDVGVHEGSPYIVSELVDGQSLRRHLHDGPLPARKVLDYARQIAEGLAAAHDKAIVHRDIKPDNLFVSTDGRIKILDFGIAKLTAPNDPAGVTGAATETADGAVIGTAGYMSPEQVRGEAVDARSDLFSVGIVVYEMLTGRSPFRRETAAETMTAVLRSEPEPLLPEVPPALVRIVSRCLEKTREMRFQSARDLAFGLEVLSDTAATAPGIATTRRQWPLAASVGLLALVVGAGMMVWITRGAAPPPGDPFANAQFTRMTDWPGTEAGAAISPDGKFVTFVSDKAGEFDLWLSQIGGGEPINLTTDFPPLEEVGPVFKKFGFSGDGAQIWFSPGTGAELAQMIMPLIGGTRRAFLERNATAPAWSPDGERIVYFINRAGDPMFLADRDGANPRPISVNRKADGKGLFDTGMHNHNPMWSWDGAWIYFSHGPEPTGAMDIWRMRPTGESVERLTDHAIAVNLLAPLDARTVLYVGRGEDWSGPWLWALDVERKTSRRISLGPGQFTSVSATRDGRRVVATIANPTATLWRAQLLNRQIEDHDVERYPVKTERALAPRFSGKTLFYLSGAGTIDGLWKAGENDAPHPIWTGGLLSEPPAVSPDGSSVVVAARQQGKRRLLIVSSDGRSVATLAPSLEVRSFFAGQGVVDWSPDGRWIVAGGTDDVQGQGLFKVPVSGGAPVRLVAGEALNPIWSPDGKFVVYGNTFATGQVDLLAVSPDGVRLDMTLTRARPGGYRFLPDGSGLVYLQYMPSLDFSFFDFATKQSRQLTRLSNQGALGTFDITPDGKAIVFGRSRENSDIVLIDLPK